MPFISSTDLIALMTGLTSEHAATLFFRILGVIYGLVAILRFVYGDRPILGLISAPALARGPDRPFRQRGAQPASPADLLLQQLGVAQIDYHVASHYHQIVELN